MNYGRVIYKIYEDTVQSGAEANLGRELTEVELKRLRYFFVEDDKFSDTIYCALVDAAEKTIKEDGWEDWDEMYKDTPLDEI